MRLKVSNVCQLLDKTEFPATQTINGVTFTNNGDGTITANGTATGLCQYRITNSYKKLIGENTNKCLLVGSIPVDSRTPYYLQLDFVEGNSWSRAALDFGKGVIFTNSDSSTQLLSIIVKSGVTVNNLVFKPQLFDLTEMYGAGNEPTTVAQFRQDFPNEMYEYSPVCWKKFRRLKYVTETKNLFKLNDFSNSWLTIKNNTIRIKKTSDLQSYSNAIFSPLQTDLKSDKYYRISAKVIGEFTGRLYKFFGNSLWGNAINNNRWQSDFTLASVEDKYGLTINQNSGTTVGCTLISDEVFIYDIMLEESDTAFVGQAEYVPSGYLPLNRGKYIANKEPVQLLDKNKYPATQTKQGVTYTNDGNGIITINGTNTASYLCVFILNVLDGKPGHKYMQLGATDDGWWNTYGLECKWIDDDGVGHGFTMTNGIMSIPSDVIVRDIFVSVLVYQGYTVSNKTFKPQFFDLTEMYGAGNEPTTVEQFRADFPNELYDYNPYNAITFR